MKLVGIILLVLLAIAAIITFVFIPIAILYNLNIDRLQKKLRSNIGERSVQTFYVWFAIGPLFNYEKKWSELIKTYKMIEKSKDVSKETKEKLLEVYKRRGCNPKK